MTMGTLVTHDDVQAAVLADTGNPDVTQEIETKEPGTETTPVEKETEGDPVETEAKKNGRKQNDAVQKRIDELTRQKNDARREAEYYRRMSEAKKEQEAPKKLSPDDFATYDDYVDAKVEQRTAALVAEHIEKQTRERQQSAEQSAQQAEHQARQVAWVEKESKITETIKDYTDVMEAAKETPISEPMVLAMLESDRGPEIAYYLAKNPGECERIAALAPFSAARAIGRIEMQLEGEPREPAAPPVSTAPKPLKSVRPSAPVTNTKFRDNMSMAEFRAWKAEQSG